MLQPTDLIIAFCICTLAATLQSAIGFGLALVAAPLLLLVEPSLVPGPLIFASLILTGLTAYRDRAHIDLNGLWTALFGRVLGSILAAIFLAFTSQVFFDLTFGSMVVLAALLSSTGIHLTPTRATTLIAGGASGLMGTISSIGGPPMALVYQNSEAEKIRGTLAGYFLLGAGISLFALWSVDRFGPEQALNGFALSPSMAIGFWAGHIMHHRIPRSVIRPLIIGLSFSSGFIVIVKAFF